MCVASDESLDGGVDAVAASPLSTTLASPSTGLGIADAEHDATDWRALRPDFADPNALPESVPNGPVDTEAGPSDLGPIENPVHVYGSSSYVAFP